MYNHFHNIAQVFQTLQALQILIKFPLNLADLYESSDKSQS